MSHGGENGIIHTDYIDSENENSKKRTKGTQVSSMLAFESYTTKEVFNALRTNRNLKRCQKIVVIQVKCYKIFETQDNFYLDFPLFSRRAEES